MKIFHALTNKFCKKHLAWNHNTLCCRKCGKIIALRYLMHGELQLYVYPECADLTYDIMTMPATKQIVHYEDYLGVIALDEWDEFIDGIKHDISYDFEQAIADLPVYSYQIPDIENDLMEEIPCTD